MELEVRAEILEVVVVGQLVGNVHVERHRGLECPAASHVADGVAAATQQHQRKLVPTQKNLLINKAAVNFRVSKHMIR